MGKLQIPENYTPVIDYMESQRAIKKIKDFFQQELAYGLQLRRVSAPLFVAPETGLNDNLNGVERTVSFTVKRKLRSCSLLPSGSGWLSASTTSSRAPDFIRI